MTSARSVITAGLAVVAIAGISTAWMASGAELPTRVPDIAHGAEIAAQGKGAAVPGCAQCHAFNGASDGSGAFPRISGQSAYYLTKQLKAFSSGDRANAVMGPIAKALSSDDIDDVAAYYTSASGPNLPLTSVNPTLFRRGEQLATIGDESKNLQSCNNCHGPGGTGEPPAIPYLAGQYAHYTAFQLQMWKRRFRKTSPDEMADVARRLDDGDIEAVAAYFQQIRSAPQPPISPKE